MEYIAPLARAREDLTADQERNEHLGVVAHVVGTAGEVVLVAAVTVARAVGVVLEQIHRAANALLVQPLFGRLHQPFQDAFAGLVVHQHLVEAVALGRGVFGV
jgi:hypothetical protein